MCFYIECSTKFEKKIGMGVYYNNTRILIFFEWYRYCLKIGAKNDHDIRFCRKCLVYVTGIKDIGIIIVYTVPIQLFFLILYFIRCKITF